MNYDEIRKASCEWCAKGVSMTSRQPGYHWESKTHQPRCTAPTPEVVIEQQSATIAALESEKAALELAVRRVFGARSAMCPACDEGAQMAACSCADILHEDSDSRKALEALIPDNGGPSV